MTASVGKPEKEERARAEQVLREEKEAAAEAEERTDAHALVPLDSTTLARPVASFDELFKLLQHLRDQTKAETYLYNSQRAAVDAFTSNPEGDGAHILDHVGAVSNVLAVRREQFRPEPPPPNANHCVVRWGPKAAVERTETLMCVHQASAVAVKLNKLLRSVWTRANTTYEHQHIPELQNNKPVHNRCYEEKGVFVHRTWTWSCKAGTSF